MACYVDKRGAYGWMAFGMEYGIWYMVGLFLVGDCCAGKFGAERTVVCGNGY